MVYHRHMGEFDRDRLGYLPIQITDNVRGSGMAQLCDIASPKSAKHQGMDAILNPVAYKLGK